MSKSSSFILFYFITIVSSAAKLREGGKRGKAMLFPLVDYRAM